MSSGAKQNLTQDFKAASLTVSLRSFEPPQLLIMAGRRAALKAADWAAFAERVTPNQKPVFNNLKTRSDAVAARFVVTRQTLPTF